MFLHLLVAALLLGVLWVRRRFAYWKDRGVPYVEPTFPHGNLAGMGSTLHMANVIRSVYGQLKGKTAGLGFAGMYFFLSPVTVVFDLELVKNVLVKDFHYFHDRSVYHNEKDDPLSEHLFAMEGTKWRSLRSKLTPTFTSGKMKMMFPTIRAVADEFSKCVAGTIKSDPELELKELLARFTTDVIGNCAFGLECNSLKDADAEFRRMGRKVFHVTRFSLLKRFLASQYPNVARRLGVTNNASDVSKFFLNAVRETVQYRITNNVQRNDFMSLLMELMREEDADPLSIEQATAQAFVFFAAGFETSSTAMAFCLYELAVNQELQRKARDNVNEVLKRYDGTLSYEALQDMVYIDMCINESLRKYSPAPTLSRIASKDYPVPGTKHVIPKGQTVLVPVHGIHHDSEYYPDPDRFLPERFDEQTKASRNPYAFLPFGEGPRNCIGLRFGLMQARIGMAVLLKHFHFTLSPKTPVPLRASPSNTVFTIDGGLFLKVQTV
ncbi:probable cytochrome P450 6a19 [Anopheles cruzii]|uniref:probable cytochrome P450 6a19 n=1 Tax=Anopheles cruzii TaxID=68878 RepID=UPI0022EC884E|nr:probable cytochrome P450 6a19 [Anopheles cruzii]